MKWTSEEIDFLKFNADMSYSLLAKHLGRNLPGVAAKSVRLGIKKPKPKEYNIDLFRYQNRDMAYILGWHMADGYMSSNGLEYKNHPQDIEVLQYLQKMICSEINIDVYQEYNKGWKKFYDKSRIRFYSKELVSIFSNQWGIPFQKTGNECFPKGLDEKFWPDFIRGYFDGDGCVYTGQTNKLRCSICCASKGFLETIKEYFGFKTNIYKGTIYNLQFSFKDSVKFREIIYNNESFALKRKKDKIFSVNACDLRGTI